MKIYTVTTVVVTVDVTKESPPGRSDFKYLELRVKRELIEVSKLIPLSSFVMKSSYCT